MHLRLFLALLITCCLSACQTTEQNQANDTAQPEIFTHFELDLSAPQPVTTDSVPLPIPKTTAKQTKAVSSDLWQYIADNMSFQHPLNKDIKQRIKWYLSQPNYLKVVNKRAAPYLYHIVKKVEQQNMPLEIALLPFVESDFRPTIQSKEHAVGVWQLVAATAYHFGVKTDQWYDGRRDVLASTDAALAYLNYLHKRFDGNWLHALAAYNTGEGRVKRAIAKNKQKGKTTDYWALDLPKETAEYVPKLMALSYLVKNPKQGLKRPKLANQALTTEFNIGQPFDFSVVANLAGVGRNQLHSLNTGYLKNQSSPDGPYTLLLPMQRSTLLRSQLFRNNFAGQYTVQQDDTLYAISRRFGLSVKELKSLNNKTTNLIKVGETLLVGKAKTLPDSLLVNYDISPYLEQNEQQVIPTIAVNYQVKPGDSIWSISQLYDVPHKDVAAWNKLTASSILKPGTVLTLHLPQANQTKQGEPSSEHLLKGIASSLQNP